MASAAKCLNWRTYPARRRCRHGGAVYSSKKNDAQICASTQPDAANLAQICARSQMTPPRAWRVAAPGAPIGGLAKGPRAGLETGLEKRPSGISRRLAENRVITVKWALLAFSIRRVPQPSSRPERRRRARGRSLHLYGAFCIREGDAETDLDSRIVDQADPAIALAPRRHAGLCREELLSLETRRRRGAAVIRPGRGGSHLPPHEPLPETSASAMRLPRKRKISNSAVFDAGREPRQDSAPWAGAAFAIRSTPGRSPSG
jgi:hypothetical protein